MMETQDIAMHLEDDGRGHQPPQPLEAEGARKQTQSFQREPGPPQPGVSPVRLISDFGPPEPRENTCVLF